MAESSEAFVRTQAAREAEAQYLSAKVAQIEAAGEKEFGGKWHEAQANLSMLDDGAQIPRELLQAAVETEEPARVLFELSKDLELADQLLEMAPVKRAIAIGRLATGERFQHMQKATESLVQPPPGDTRDRPSDRDSDEEWNRKEEIRERRLLEQRRRGVR